MQNSKLKNTIQKSKLVKFFIFLFVLLPFAFLSSKVSAHILTTDKSIGAVLHINPDDDPVANTPASFFFEFKDKTNTFSPQECDCTFIILENGKQIYSQPLFQDSTNPNLQNASVNYTFAKSDVYEIRVIGKPLSKTGFQPFTLSWNIRVEKGDTKTDQNQTTDSFFTSHLSHFIIAGIAILAFLVLYIYQTIDKKKQKHD